MEGEGNRTILRGPHEHWAQPARVAFYPTLYPYFFARYRPDAPDRRRWRRRPAVRGERTLSVCRANQARAAGLRSAAAGAAPLRLRRRPRNQLHPQRSAHALHGVESRLSTGPQGLVQRLKPYARALRNAGHAARAGDRAQRVRQGRRVVLFEHDRQVRATASSSSRCSAMSNSGSSAILVMVPQSSRDAASA